MGVSGVRNLRVWAALLMAVLAASVLMAAALAGTAQAASLTVTTADEGQNDNGLCSLREAIINANQNDQSGSTDCAAGVGEDAINFDPSLSGQTITLGSQLTVADSAGLTIDGGGANITVSGGGAVRVFQVGIGGKLALDRLTVANGQAGNGNYGGGILNEGTLTVSNSTLSGNIAFLGGGIYNDGTLTVGNSTFSGNNAPNGGGIYNNGTLTVGNSTLSGNEANYGGGVYNEGTTTVSNSTLSGNIAYIGSSGIHNNGTAATLENTIVANTIVEGSLSPGDCGGAYPITDGGHNLDSGTTCGFATANNSLSDTDPKLGALADNGGSTKTHALLAGSPAIDKGDPFGATTDQRGVARPQGAASDIGAFESESTVIEDTTKPTVSAASPTGTGVGRGTNVVATFSEKMDAATINKTTFRLFKVTSTGTTQVTNVTVALSSDGLKATLDPFGTSTTLLAANTKYRAVLTTGAEDVAGNALDQNPTRAGNQQKAWTFTTRG